MMVGLALTAIAGAVVTAAGLFPAIGPWSILLAPVGGSCAAVAAGMIGAAVHGRGSAVDADVDLMVGALRSVLDDTKRAEAHEAASDARPDATPDAAQPPVRAAG